MRSRQHQLMQEPATLWTATRLIIGILYQMNWLKKLYCAGLKNLGPRHDKHTKTLSKRQKG